MRILSSIISGIWNTVTFMDKEQRALIAHVLTVSQAHPKSFSYDNLHGVWQSKGLKIKFWQKGRTIDLSNVTYRLGWRANAILARHFAMLHICLHHEHIGKALSEIDAVENKPKESDTCDTVEPSKSSSITTNFKREFAKRDAENREKQKEQLVTASLGKRFKMVTPTDGFATKVVQAEKSSINLANFVGKEVVITRLDGSQSHAEVFLYGKGRYEVAGSIYFTNGKIWESGRPASANDITKIELVIPVKEEKPKWVTDIDLTKWIGKTVDVKLRNGLIIDDVHVSAEPKGVVYIVKLGDMPYTKQGGYWRYTSDDRDVIEIKLSN